MQINKLLRFVVRQSEVYILFTDAHYKVWVGQQSRDFTQILMSDKVLVERFVTDPSVLVIKAAT